MGLIMPVFEFITGITLTLYLIGGVVTQIKNPKKKK